MEFFCRRTNFCHRYTSRGFSLLHISFPPKEKDACHLKKNPSKKNSIKRKQCEKNCLYKVDRKKNTYPFPLGKHWFKVLKISISRINIEQYFKQFIAVL